MTKIIHRTLFGEYDKVQRSIEFLKTFEPLAGYYLAFSGGKDSCVLKAVADLAGVKYDAHYEMTGIDPPELVQFIRTYHKDVQIHGGKRFFTELVKRGFPQRQRRWCCEFLKESGGSGRRVLTGIRWEESNKRRHRKQVETCYKDSTKQYFNPIIDWTTKDIWKFIHENNIPYCKLYDKGKKRLGCLLCPLSSNRIKEAKEYPRYTNAFRLAFNRLYKRKVLVGQTKSISRWKNGDEMFDWWMNEKRTKHLPEQLVMFE